MLKAYVNAIKGDFITRRQQRFIPNLTATMGQLAAKDGKFGVLGNHDYWSDADAVSRAIAQTNVFNLANSFQTIQRGSAKCAKLYIAITVITLNAKINVEVRSQTDKSQTCRFHIQK